ncbi:MAG: hypothetical protein ACOCQR_02100 [bacterium]
MIYRTFKQESLVRDCKERAGSVSAKGLKVTKHEITVREQVRFLNNKLKGDGFDV